MRRLTIPLLTGTLLLAAGCGTETGTGPATAGSPARDTASTAPSTAPSAVPSTVTATLPSQPVASTVAPRDEPTNPAPAVPSRGPKPVKATGDTENPRKVRWLTAERHKNDRTLRIVWWSGVEPCTVLDRVTVKETRQKVTVTLWEGPSRTMQNVACIEIAIKKSTTVKLARPLGKRKVADGAR
ncbi:hypothetical protein ACFOWE_10080 [Planomonospora corallina]|uniref:Uncharacterized protein n=1 Tax=Planomonospora corallina TaxID=1806052 RepID=A0ABV8I6F2_9ACTN